MLKALRDHPKLAGAEQVATLTTTYFDTLGGKLRRGGAGLRVRDDGQSLEQTLKLAATGRGSVRRREWNVAGPCRTPDPAAFTGTARAALAKLLDGEPLEPVGTTTITRTTRRIRAGHSAIEVAIDEGQVEAGARREGLFELELELVEGKLADLLDLALDLPVGPELMWSVRSKAERCHELAFDLLPAAARAAPVGLSNRMGVARGFQAIAWNCLEQLLANYPLVIGSGDAEAVHQTRVALRRLRAAFSLFDDIVDDEVAPVLRAALKAVALGLAPARDLHVLLERIASSGPGSHVDTGELEAHLAARKAQEIRAAQTMLSGPQFQKLLLELARWIEAGDWLAQARKTGSGLSLSTYAAGMFSRRRRKLGKAAGRLSGMTDAELHHLRIRVKKLRYAVEFFSALHRGDEIARQRRPFVRALARLQERLGMVNDLAVATAGRSAWFADADPITAARLEAQLDELLATRGKSRRKLIAKAEEFLDRVAQSPAWWKAGS